ncbi:MAG: cyanophycinase [Pirellulales bacterium]|nr:cyanophycinase [Pirellulales bacterium]
MKALHWFPLLVTLHLLFLPQNIPAGDQFKANNPLGLPEGAAESGGTLLIGGGGRTPRVVFDEFFRLAGGKNARIVHIPSAYPYDSMERLRRCFQVWREYHPASFQFLNFQSPKDANARKPIWTLNDATGVWISGGYQNRLMRIIGGTKAEAALHRLLARGGVIGGESAGSSAMSDIMISHGSRTKAHLGKGLGLIDNAVVDQHFSQRGRGARLLGVLEDHPDVVGLGVDEQTSLLIRGNHLRVIGNQRATVFLRTGQQRSLLLYRLRPGDEAELISPRGKRISLLMLHQKEPVRQKQS